MNSLPEVSLGPRNNGLYFVDNPDYDLDIGFGLLSLNPFTTEARFYVLNAIANKGLFSI